MSTFTPIDPPDPDDDSFAAQLVRRHEPWLTADLDGFLRAVASMFDQVVTYSADTDTNEGWVILFDPDLCPAEALPYLGQLVGEVPPMPVGLPEAAAREWIKDNPNARRGTAQSVFQAAQRKLTGSRQVSMFERYQGVVDQLAIRTNTTQTPDPAGTRADILSTLPADVVLEGLGHADVGADRLGPLREADAMIRQVRQDMDRLRGRLFQLVELADLPPAKAAAFKGCIRTTSYDAQADLEALARGER
jgi:hypothetical protein